MADQFTRKIAQTVRDTGAVQYLFIPALAGNGVGGVVLAAGGGPGFGAWADLAAAGAIATEFWVCGVQVYTAGGAQVMEVQVQNATLARTIGNWAVDITAVTVNLSTLSIGPFPVYCAAGSQIQGRTGGAAAKAFNAHLAYATGF